jgi:hypothetical protein
VERDVSVGSRRHAWSGFPSPAAHAKIEYIVYTDLSTATRQLGGAKGHAYLIAFASCEDRERWRVPMIMAH